MRTPSLRRMVSIAGMATVLAAATLAVGPSPAVAAPPGVEPPLVTLTLGPGGSATVDKVVHTAPVPPNPDVVLLADTTGSMTTPILDVQANIPTIVNTVSGAQPSAQFAVAEFKDLTADPFGFRVNQNTTADQNLIQAGVNQWVASGGGDDAEDWINALGQIATGAISFRPGGSRIVAIFGDAPSHDESDGHGTFTFAETVAALQAAGIRVVAVGVPGAGSGLDAGGRMTQLTNATGGVFLPNVPPQQVAQAILDGIQAIKVTVTPTVVSCDSPLSLAFNPTSRQVESGSDATFAETVTVAGNAAAGTYQCVVDFLVNGASSGFIQRLTVVVPGLSVNDVTVTEGAGPATFTVSLSAPSPNPVTVQFATADGTATAPGDYSATSGTVTFAPGQTSRTVSVPIVDDAVDEVTETFRVRLSSASGAALTDPLGIGTIVDNDRNGVFSCQATAAQVAGLVAARANPPNVPCADDNETVAQIQLSAGLVTVRANALTARTDQTPDVLTNTAPAAGDNATSTARVETTRITVLGGVVIELGVIESTASVTCVPKSGGLEPVFESRSRVASLKINGVTVDVGEAPLTIPLVVGSLSLNSTVTTGTSVVQRAVVLDTLLVDVVLGEAKADVTGTGAHPTGNPCRV